MATKKAKPAHVAKAKKMAAATRKKRRSPARRRYRFGFVSSPEARKWRLWCHDVDTLLHAMVKNPSMQQMTPKKVIALAEAFADEYHAMQDRRRPEGVDPEDR